MQKRTLPNHALLKWLTSRKVSATLLSVFLATCSCRAELVHPPVAQEGPIIWTPEQARLETSHFSLSEMLVGAGSASIEPPHPTPLFGFGGVFRRLVPPAIDGVGGSLYQASYKSVDLAPRVKVIVFGGTNNEGRRQSFVIISVDVVAISQDISIKILQHIQKSFPELDLNSTDIQIVATHTHSGPAGLSADPLFEAVAGDLFNPNLWKFFLGQAEKAVRQAIQHKLPVSKAFFQESMPEGFNRSRLEGVDVDKRHLLMTFYTDNPEKPEACLSVYALHPTVISQKSLVLSSDLAGHIEKTFEAKLGASTCIFMPGAIGNADASRRPDETMDDYAGRLAHEAVGVPTSPLFTEDSPSPLRFGAEIVKLPDATANFAGCGAALLKPFVSLDFLKERPPYSKIGYFRWGPLMLVFFPGEPTTDLLEQFKEEVAQREPDVHPYLVATSNDYLGYIVSDAIYKRRSLESCSALYSPKLGQTLLKHAMSFTEGR